MSTAAAAEQSSLADPATAPGPILVFGAGSVGCFIGGCLLAAGVPGTLVGRPRITAALREAGLTLTDCDGGRWHLAPGSVACAERVPAGAAPALVLFAVKSGATASAAAELAAAVPAGTLVLMLQNGVGNETVARAAAPGLAWVPAMVPYNIAELGPGCFHRGTGGRLAAQDHPQLAAWLPWFDKARLKLKLYPDLAPVQWGKLLINLNNPVNALSGQPLRTEFEDPGYRRCLAALIEEAIGIVRAAGIEPAQAIAVPPQKFIRLLRLPNFIFRIVARKMLRIDPLARSSMADDLSRGRVTEIDVLCGEIVRLAARQGRTAPLNARMVALVEAWPAEKRFFTGRELWRALNAA